MANRKSYPISFKRDALHKLSENNGNVRQIARDCGVSFKMIRDWRCKSSTILSGEFKSKNRRIGNGSQPKWPEIERNLVEWIHEEREKKNRVSYNRAIDMAHKLASDSNILDGKFGYAWLQKVLRRNKLTVRKATHYGQENRRTSFEQFEISLNHLQDLNLLCQGIPPNFIINMDETPVYYDMPSSRTISILGEQTTAINTTGKMKKRITAVLAITSSGQMLPCMVILKGLKKVPKIPVPSNIILRAAFKGSMTENLMIDWIDSVLKPHVISKSVLILDDFASHKTDKVKEKLENLDVSYKLIPPQTTHYHQPLDVLIMSVFKAAMRNEYENWISNSPAIYTAKGNRKSPSHSTIIQFISNSLKKIHSDTIVKSFHICGISSSGEIPVCEFNEMLKSVHQNTDRMIDFHSDSDTEIDEENAY